MRREAHGSDLLHVPHDAQVLAQPAPLLRGQLVERQPVVGRRPPADLLDLVAQPQGVRNR